MMTVVRIVPLGLRCSRCLLLIETYTCTSSVQLASAREVEHHRTLPPGTISNRHRPLRLSFRAAPTICPPDTHRVVHIPVAVADQLAEGDDLQLRRAVMLEWSVATMREHRKRGL